MGTDGGSVADPGRGTHRRSRLTTPHLAHLATNQLQTTTEKKTKISLGWLSSEAEAGWTVPDGVPDVGEVRRLEHASRLR